MTEVRLRPLAERDLLERTAWYRAEGGDGLGARFFDAAIECLDSMADMPAAGSLRIGELCAVPGLRSRRTPGFPCGWFYFERADHVDVVRLLAHAQDLETLLGDTDD